MSDQKFKLLKNRWLVKSLGVERSEGVGSPKYEGISHDVIENKRRKNAMVSLATMLMKTNQL